ncbi:MAG: monomeric [FeFe] hydrogenase [Desulfonauticus sp.]|nr:monomeric [FeFe] hydrogenase [Desulfonauticus sp.]
MRRLVVNHIVKMRRDIYRKIVEAYKNNTLKKELPKFWAHIISDEEFMDRRKFFYEREVIKEKIKFALGLNYKKVKDMELYEITQYLDEILEGASDLLEKENFMEIIEILCAECPGGRYYITELCRNCLAHPCTSVCTKGGIKIVQNRAQIDYSECINCGLCASACPYHAITKLEKPCTLACYCEVIHINQKGRMELSSKDCASCGACYLACPFGALETSSMMLQVLHRLKREKMIAIYAPAAITQFKRKASVEQFIEALKILGFDEVFEVAIGADMVAEAEALHFLEHGGLMLTSCCPSYVRLVKQRWPEFAQNISPIPSPMVMLAQKLRKDYPEHKIVFIGPCIAKKKEAIENSTPDYVLTFEETAIIFEVYGINVPLLKGEKTKEATPYAWGFATTGGVGEAVRYYVKKHAGDTKANSLKILSANGLKECDKYLKEIKRGKLEVDILEGMGCDGGCIAGPGVMVDPISSKALLMREVAKMKQNG